MKTKFITALSLLMLFVSASAQSVQTEVKNIRFIEVTGTSEMTISPDEIYVSITLKEYKDGGNKVLLSALEKQLQEVMKQMQIPEKSLTITGSYGYQYERKKNKQDFFMSKTYQLKLNSLSRYDELIARLDDHGINQVYLSESTHSKIEQFKLQVKTDAVKAARNKAKILLVALDAQLGNVLEVREQEMMYYQPRIANSFMEADMAYKSTESTVEVRDIKLTQSMVVKFEIK